MNLRIISKLDVKPPYVVKPIQFEGLRKIGDVQSLSKKYFEDGADEILYVDTVSSLYQRGIIYEDIKRTAKALFVPLCVGGAVRSIEDFSKLFHSGADKVSINTFALQEDPTIIDRASKIFGSQAVVVNIEAKYYDNDWYCYTDGGKIKTNRRVLDWVIEVQERGCGEILLQSIDKDGMKNGFDKELSYEVINRVNIPVIVASGAGSLEDIKDLVDEVNPSGIAVSSLLHYNIHTIKEIKWFLNKNGVKVSL